MKLDKFEIDVGQVIGTLCAIAAFSLIGNFLYMVAGMVL